MLSTMQQPKEPEEELPKGVILRDFDDFTTLRNQIFDGVKNSMIKSFPAEYGNVRLELHDVDYDNLDDVPVSEQKKNLLENKYITKKLRGTLKLFDKTNDQLLEEKRISLMKVPYLTNRGTFIHGGNEYASIMQSRLLPGVYTRRQANGELETQFNVKPGTGIGFRVGFEPETTQYRVKISQANLHLYSLLKDIGTSDKELEKAWGPEILRANQMKYDARVFDKAYDRLVPARQKKVDKTREDKVNSLKNAFEAAQIHARVAQKNLPNMFDPKVAAEWEARWQGKQAMEKLAAESIDSIPFEPDLTPKEAAETFIDEDIIRAVENEIDENYKAAAKSEPRVFYHGSPTPGIEILEPRRDPRLNIEGLFVADEPHTPEMFSLLPERHSATVNSKTENGEFKGGDVVSKKDLNDVGYLYKILVSDPSIIKERKPGRFILTKSVKPSEVKEILKDDVLKKGWKVSKPDQMLEHYVPEDQLESVKAKGLLSREDIMNSHPDVLAYIAKQEGRTPEEQKARFEELLKERPHQGGVSALFAGPPDVNALPENHPMRKYKMKKVLINLSKFLKDNPAVKLHGAELTPYGKHKTPEDRHHDLTPEELLALVGKSSQELWSNFSDPEGKGFYAADVPHVIIPKTIDPKYLKFE